MELVVDTREQSLYNTLQESDFGYPVRQECLTIGDVWIRNEEDILLLIERKTVADLCASLRDGRYHDQRRRWKQFQEEHPQACVSLWIEGDLISAPGIDETLRGSLMNSLFRLQMLHRIIVHHVRDRRSFVTSLRLAVQKFEKDPHHLLHEKTQSSSIPLDMQRYKKSHDVDAGMVWRAVLTLIPGISRETAEKITAVFPTQTEFFHADRETAMNQLATLLIRPKRRLGQKAAEKIMSLLRTSA